MRSRVVVALTALATVLVLAAPAAAQRAQPSRFGDGWLGEDKARHMAISAAITGFGYGGARVVFDRDTSLGVALGAAAVAGLLREVHDRRVGKPFSLNDLVWDAVGVAAGYFWIREIE